MQNRPSFKAAKCIMNFKDTDMHAQYSVFAKNLKMGAGAAFITAAALSCGIIIV
jgi:hypothetical protein